MTYRSEAVSADLPTFASTGGVLTRTGTEHFGVDQPYQIAVLTDLCNECGNCVTACPTSGTPYVDKPRLYLDDSEFLAEETNAFMVRDDTDAVTVLGRFGGITHRLSINGSVAYEGPSLRATFDEDLGFISADTKQSGHDGEVSLLPAAIMYTLWKGLNDSMPELPTATDAGTRIQAPELANP